ncbi:MAG: amidohydrolase family protein, partial [Chloroflexota bacterium]
YDFLEGMPKHGLRDTCVSPLPWLDGRHALVDTVRWTATSGKVWGDFMDYAGIDQAVIYPSSGLALGLIQITDYAINVARAYNRWLHASHLQPEPRLRAPALLPLQDPTAAAEELRFAVEQLGMVGGMLCSVTWNMKPLGEPEFEPIYAEAERLDVPLILHGGTTQGLGLDMLRRWPAAHALEHPLPLFIHLTSMVYEGVFDRHPNLRVGLFEAGTGWLPFMMDRLDYDAHALGKNDPAISKLRRKPSAYIQDHIYVTCEPGERFLPLIAQAIGEDKIMYASDFPHELEYEDYPEDIEELAERADLSETARRNILGTTAAAFYKLSAGTASKTEGSAAATR